MTEDMQAAWLEIEQMLGEATREEFDVFLRTWQRAVQATRKTLAKPDFWEGYVPEPTVKQSLTVEQAQQEPTCKQNLQVWVQRTGQFSWEPQDERFWTRMQPAHHTEQHLEMVANQSAQQEPVPWSQALENVWAEPDEVFPPAQRTWVDLTPQNLNEIFKVANTGEGAVHLALKLIKEKNT